MPSFDPTLIATVKEVAWPSGLFLCLAALGYGVVPSPLPKKTHKRQHLHNRHQQHLSTKQYRMPNGGTVDLLREAVKETKTEPPRQDWQPVSRKQFKERSQK